MIYLLNTKNPLLYPKKELETDELEGLKIMKINSSTFESIRFSVKKVGT
jgi:hypothetical protein